MNRAYRIALVVVFCLLCSVPGAAMLMRPEDPGLWGVKRVDFPRFEAKWSWVSDFERYFVANFGLKRNLVQLHNLFGYHVVHDLQSDNVLVGKGGWLFLSQDNGWTSFRSEGEMSSDSVRGWHLSLVALKRFLASRHTPMVTLIPPSKETIYPEFLPASATRAKPVTRLDQVLEIYKSTGNDYVDLRAPFLAAKPRAQLYARFDSHWNGNGALLAAQLLMQRVTALLDRPASYAELDSLIDSRRSSADLSSILALDDYVLEQSVGLVPRAPRARRVKPDPSLTTLTRRDMDHMVFEVDDPSLPTALILRDSFAEMMTLMLAEKFRRSVWIWTHDFDMRYVDREHPDIVIMETTERFFASPPPHFIVGERRRPRRR
jgi:alginate O-acetyltransferase complex protein AlgJ